MNGVTLTEEQLHKTKRIVVVSLAADSVTYYRQLPSVVQRTANVSSWQLDAQFADRFANGVSSALSIAAVPYNGERRSELGKVYESDARLRANRFNWEGIKAPIEAIANETKSDLVLLLLKDSFQDPTARFRFETRGLALSDNSATCVAFAHMTLIALIPGHAKPVAGANVYVTNTDGRIVSSMRRVPEAACRTNLDEWSIGLQESLRKVYLEIISERMAKETSWRLAPFQR